jgi:hypothetical protein
MMLYLAAFFVLFALGALGALVRSLPFINSLWLRSGFHPRRAAG